MVLHAPKITNDRQQFSEIASKTPLTIECSLFVISCGTLFVVRYLVLFAIGYLVLHAQII